MSEDTIKNSYTDSEEETTFDYDWDNKNEIFIFRER